MNEIVFAACAIAVAATVQSLTGFGFGMVSMALLPLVLPVTEAVPVVSLLGVLVNVAVLARYRRALDRRTALPVVVGSLIGVPVGVAFLTGAEPALLRVVLGAVLVAFSLHGLLSRAPAPAAPSAAGGWHAAVGAAAGVSGGALGGAFNVGGPPLILYVTWRGLAPDVMKATLQCCFLLGACVQLPLFVHHGLVTREAIVSAGAGVPATGLGIAAGFLLSRRISREAFRRIVLVLLLALGAWFLVHRGP